MGGREMGGGGGGGAEEGRGRGGGNASHSLRKRRQLMATLPSLLAALNTAQLDCIFHAQNAAARPHNASVNRVQILRRWGRRQVNDGD